MVRIAVWPVHNFAGTGPSMRKDGARGMRARSFLPYSIHYVGLTRFPNPLHPSRRHGYFASVPEREYLPVFWTPEELAGIRGTELEMDIEQEVANLRADYEEQISPLCAKHGLEKYGYSFERFQAAASLVASRAFKVDDELGEWEV